MWSSFCSVPLASHLTSRHVTKSNLYPVISLETVTTASALYKLRTFHVPNLMCIFRRLGRLSEKSLQLRGSVNCFVRSLTCMARGYWPYAVCPRLLIRYIRIYPPWLEAVPPSATQGRAMLWCEGTPPNVDEKEHQGRIYTLGDIAVRSPHEMFKGENGSLLWHGVKYVGKALLVIQNN
jgi:hypothetical protein